MAAKLIQIPISASSLVSLIPMITKLRRTPKLTPSIHPWTHKTRFGETPSGLSPISTIKVAEPSSGLVGDEEDTEQEEEPLIDSHIKTKLYQAVEGINRGIFGVPSKKKTEIEDLVKQLESQNPTPDPTLHLHTVSGCWRLLYSTITILGSRRTKLGLRDFITLGDFLQTIDVTEGKAENVIKFSARGFSAFNGQLTIEASFKIASNSRVDITYNSSSITPEQLMNLFRKNYDILLGIFNPEGWLEITYVDDSMRIGRDDKGNIFILER